MRPSFVALVLALSSLSGCGLIPLYEGQPAAITLDSEPRGATVYLVPLKEWQALGGEAALDDLARLEPHRVREGPTPVTVSRVMHRFEYVAILGRQKNHAPVTPGMTPPLADGRKDTALLVLHAP